MITIDVKCKDCKHVFEISKKSILDDFEFNICSKCGSSNVNRVWDIGATDIAVGKLGNSSTNFNTGPTSHPSKYGKYKGIKIK